MGASRSTETFEGCEINMKLLIISILLLFGDAVCLHVQDSGVGPIKVDSYNDRIPSSEAEQWRLEDFRQKLLDEPESKAYIIAYAGREDPPGKAKRYALRARNWLVQWRGLEEKRIVAIDGGRREEFTVDLWIVPTQSRPPAPTPNVAVKMDLNDNVLFDEFDFGYDNFANRSENDAARLDGFAEALKKEPKAWGCVIAYAHTGDDRIGDQWDPPGAALKIARQLKTYLATEKGVSQSRLSAIDGGYAGRIVQLWVMRPGARFDRGPFIYSTRLRANGGSSLTLNSRDSSDLCCKVCIRAGADPYIFRNSKRRNPQ